MKKAIAILTLCLLAQVGNAQQLQMTFYDFSSDGDNITHTYFVAVPVTEQVTQTYTVAVPYTEEVENEDGDVVQVTKTRNEVRTREIPVTRMVTEERNKIIPLNRMSKYHFSDLTGKAIDNSEISELFKDGKKVLVLVGENQLTEFHKEILHPETIVLTIRQENK